MELYIHIPFCVKKCEYCDFLSFSMGKSRQKDYMCALRKEIASVKTSHRQITSIFVGGGTPSVLGEGEIAALFEQIRESFSLQADCEISIECNPGTLSGKKVEEYQNAGINRISLGCQSMDDTELKCLGRIHNVGQFLESYQMVREGGFQNVNIDLMSAIPGQTVESWEKNLRLAAALQPEHLSAYSLIVEEGTPFSKKKLNLPKEEEEREMYQMTGDILQEYGYHQYEISNYAKEGKECRHNKGYWQREEYLGLGLGAASLENQVRFSNTREFGRYLCYAEEPEKIRENIEQLSVREQMEEFMFLGLRMTCGVSRRRFCEEFKKEMDMVYPGVVERMVQLGLMEEDGDSVRLTREGISVSNAVFVEFLLDS